MFIFHAYFPAICCLVKYETADEAVDPNEYNIVDACQGAAYGLLGAAMHLGIGYRFWYKNLFSALFFIEIF